jgi:hypothetical protein
MGMQCVEGGGGGGGGGWACGLSRLPLASPLASGPRPPERRIQTVTETVPRTTQHHQQSGGTLHRGQTGLHCSHACPVCCPAVFQNPPACFGPAGGTWQGCWTVVVRPSALTFTPPPLSVQPVAAFWFARLPLTDSSATDEMRQPTRLAHRRPSQPVRKSPNPLGGAQLLAAAAARCLCTRSFSHFLPFSALCRRSTANISHPHLHVRYVCRPPLHPRHQAVVRRGCPACDGCCSIVLAAAAEIHRVLSTCWQGPSAAPGAV